MFKAQADIVSAVIVVLLALSLTSAALIWGLPLIQKRQDSALVTRVHNAFNQDLPSRIENIANVGGSTTFSLDVDGIWVLNETNNTISFTFYSTVSDKGTNTWIGKDCPFDPNKKGKIGIDGSSVVCVFATPAGSGFNITYQVGFRELESTDEPPTRGYKIELKSGSPISISKGKTIQISRPPDAISQTQDGQKTLITTKIEILL